jgi:PAS domain S-box-containing protein
MTDRYAQIQRVVLSRILDIVADAAIAIDVDQTILFFSQAAERMFGYHADEVLGRSLEILLPLREAAGHIRHVHQFVQAEDTSRLMNVSSPLRGRRKDGNEFPVEVTIAKLVDGGQTLLVAIARDITQRRHAEEALAESEERYRALFENSIDGVLLTSPSGDILAANPEACRLLGRTEEEICRVGRLGVVDLVDPRLPTLLDERTRVSRFRGELTLVRGDGTRFPAEVSSGLFRDRAGHLRTSMVFRDITERVQAFQLLEQRVVERTRELTALLEVGRDIASTFALDLLLNTILTRLRTVVDYTGAGIAILKDGELEMVGYWGPVPHHKIVGSRISLERDTAYQHVARWQEPVIIDDLWADTPWPQAGWEGRDEELVAHLRSVHSWLGVPLITKGEFIGLLRLDHVEPGHFTQRHAQQALAFANQASVAIENARLYEQAQRAATIEERQRLSRELHDSVSQALYGIVLGARTARTLLERDPQAAAEPLQYVLTLAEDALAEMRAMIFELRPDSLETEGLVAALLRQSDLMRARYKLVIDAALSEEPALPLEAKEALYRIAREAMNNIARHAQAQRVTIRLQSAPDSVTLEISDDGRGFDASASYAGHMGLQSMRERAERLKATCEIASSPGQGTTLRVHVPTRAPSAPE